MISKLRRRVSEPQEQLRQFSLNTSKGIDESRPSVDADTVSYMKNLTVNPDGSLSLRKRMLHCKNYETRTSNPCKVHLMHTGKHVLVVTKGNYGVFNRYTDESCTVSFKANDYYTLEDIELSSGAGIGMENATFFNTVDKTILGNCTIHFNSFKDKGIFDEDLYDETQITLPRYIQIVQTGDNAFEFRIVNPELNVLTTAEGEVPLNPNMTLDNPYAIRDVYKSSVVQVSGILPYVLDNSDTGMSFEKQSAKAYSSVNANSVPITYVQSIFPRDPTKSTAEDSGMFLHIFGTSVDTAHPNLDTSITKLVASYEHGASIFLNISAKRDKPFSDDDVIQGSVILGYQSAASGFVVFPNLDGVSTNVSFELNQANSMTHNRVCDISEILEAARTAGLDITASDIVIYRATASLQFTKAVFDEAGSNSKNSKISQVTESVKKEASEYSFKLANTVGTSETPTPQVFLKAFCKFPRQEGIYCSWEYSDTGNIWNAIKIPNISGITLVKRNALYTKHYSDLIYAMPIDPNWSPEDKLQNRPDVLPVHLLDTLNIPKTSIFRFRMFSISEDAPRETTSSGEVIAYGEPDTVYELHETTIPFGVRTELAETDLPNAVLGEKTYYKKSVYSYGEGYNGIVYVSDVGSFITPMYNALEIGSSAQALPCAIVPWRDYILTFTESDVSLSSKSDAGFYTKTISTSVGIPYKDRRCACSALNGVIFKSENKIYYAYPSMYSSDDTVLNLTDLSKPVQSILDSITSEECFADVLDDAYILMIPNNTTTHCLRYDLSTRVWEFYEYPAKFLKFFKNAKYVSVVSEYTVPNTLFTFCYAESLIFDNDYSKLGETFPSLENLDYGDITDVANVSDPNKPDTEAIAFEWDTGQKTDAMSPTKQFVETKLVFATIDEKDSFPFSLDIAVDGDSRVIHTDVSTDSAFWKHPGALAGLGVNFPFGGTPTPASGIFNTVRQYVTRYSGKGKSARHYLSGSSVCNFKLYETYVRYKRLGGK